MNRYYQNSLEKLDSCIILFNEANVNFTVNLGDIVDRNTDKNLPIILSRFQNLDSIIYNTTGNHDYDGVSDNSWLYSILGMPNAYYSFEYSDWLFLMLNTNEVSSYANINQREFEDEYYQMIGEIEQRKLTNGAIYNGGISKKQLSWLNKELKKSKDKNQKVIIFTHHPLYAPKAKSLTALNSFDIVKTITQYDNVKLVISGHHHAGDYAEYRGIPFITFEGMVETEKSNACAIIELGDDFINIKSKGRATSYLFEF